MDDNNKPRKPRDGDDRRPRRDDDDRRPPRRDNDRPSYSSDRPRRDDDRPRSRYEDDRGPRRDSNDRPSYSSDRPRRDDDRRPRFDQDKPRRPAPEVRTQVPIIETDDEEAVDTSVLVETERFVVWVSNEPDDERVYHVELDTVTLHFFSEDWEEFIALVQGALQVDGGKPKAKKKVAAGKKPKLAATPDTVIGELEEGAVEVGGEIEIDHDAEPIDLSGDDEGNA